MCQAKYIAKKAAPSSFEGGTTFSKVFILSSLHTEKIAILSGLQTVGDMPGRHVWAHVAWSGIFLLCWHRSSLTFYRLGFYATGSSTRASQNRITRDTLPECGRCHNLRLPKGFPSPVRQRAYIPCGQFVSSGQRGVERKGGTQPVSLLTVTSRLVLGLLYPSYIFQACHMVSVCCHVMHTPTKQNKTNMREIGAQTGR